MKPLRIVSPVAAAALGSVAALALLVSAAGVAQAGPKGGAVKAGEARISARGGVTTIRQGGKRVVIDWKSFDVDADEAVRFMQPDRKAVALNRVTDGLPTHIRGALLANGNVWLVNPSGVMFHAGSVVDVGGLIATTADVADERFMAGDYRFDRAGEPGAKIVNEGDITFAEAGLAGLVAPHVENRGVIAGELGRIVVAGKESFSVDISGDGLFEIDLGSLDPEAYARVSNSGVLSAEGGTIVITAAAARDAVAASISLGGVVAARNARVEGGTIVLDGGEGRVEVDGRIDATGSVGGRIDVTGGDVRLGSTARLDASGETGGGLVRLGGGPAGDPAEARSVAVERDARLAADAHGAGDGGEILVWSSEATVMFGSASAKGGATAGQGGFVEISSRGNLAFDGTVDISAPWGADGVLLLDPRDVLIVDDAPGAIDLTADVLASDGGASDFFVTASSISGNSGAMRIQATRDITVEVGGRVDNPDPGASLALEAGRDVVLRDDLLVAGGLSLTADAAVAAGRPDGVGAIRIEGDLEVGAARGALTLSAPEGLDGTAMTASDRLSLRALEDLSLADAVLAGSLSANSDGSLSVADSIVSGDVDLASGASLSAVRLSAGGLTVSAGRNASFETVDHGIAALEASGDLTLVDVSGVDLSATAGGALEASGLVAAGLDLEAGGPLFARDVASSSAAAFRSGGALQLSGLTGVAIDLAAGGVLVVDDAFFDDLVAVGAGAVELRRLSGEDVTAAAAGSLLAEDMIFSGADLAAGGDASLARFAGDALEAGAGGGLAFSDLRANSASLVADGDVTGDRLRVNGSAELRGAAMDLGDLLLYGGLDAVATRGLEIDRAVLAGDSALSVADGARLSRLDHSGGRLSVEVDGSASGPASLVNLRAEELRIVSGGGVEADATTVSGDAVLRATGGDVRLGTVEAGGELRVAASAGDVVDVPGLPEAEAFYVERPAPPAPFGSAGPPVYVPPAEFETEPEVVTEVQPPRPIEPPEPPAPEILSVTEKDLLELFVSYGNEELWGLPPGYFLEVDLEEVRGLANCEALEDEAARQECRGRLRAARAAREAPAAFGEEMER